MRKPLVTECANRHILRVCHISKDSSLRICAHGFTNHTSTYIKLNMLSKRDKNVKWVTIEAHLFYTIQKAEYKVRDQRRSLLPQILCASKLEDQTPEKTTGRRCDNYMVRKQEISSVAVLRTPNLPEEDESILKENGNTRIQDWLL